MACLRKLSFSLGGEEVPNLVPSTQILGKAMDLYLKAIESMKERVAPSLARYDVHVMGCGIIIIGG